MPKISVVIPTYNRSAYLDATITSALAQCGADFEIIISDNHSEDDTQAVVNKYLADNRVHYFKNETNIGMVRNWRKAVYEYATGDWFILLSDDDYLTDPSYLAKASRLIDDNPSVVMVYAEGYLLDETTGEQKPLILPFEGVVKGVDVFTSRNTVKPQDFTLCNVVFDRRLTIELNGFSNPNNLSCDSELFLKLALMGDVGVVKGAVSVYRFHPGNLIRTVNKSPDLLYGNLDYLLTPYVFAKDRLSFSDLATFKKNTKIEIFLANSLLMIACLSWKKFLKYYQEVAQRTPDLSAEATNSTVFKIKLFICRFGGLGLPVILKVREKIKWLLRLTHRWRRAKKEVHQVY